jgi:hypothetical protein
MPLGQLFSGWKDFVSKQPKILCRFDELAQLNHCVGDEVKGTIFLSSQSDFRVASLEVTLVGREEVQHGAKKAQSTIRPTLMFKVINQAGFPAGSHVFPFALPIPPDTQPTVFCPGHFVAAYSLQADLKLTDGSSEVYAFYQDVCLHIPVPSGLPPAFVEKKQGRLLHHQECLTLRCIPSSSILQLGVPFSLDLSLQNDTRKEVSRVIVGLERTVHTGKSRKAKTLTVIYQEEVREAVLPGGK